MFWDKVQLTTNGSYRLAVLSILAMSMTTSGMGAALAAAAAAAALLFIMNDFADNQHNHNQQHQTNKQCRPIFAQKGQHQTATSYNLSHRLSFGVTLQHPLLVTGTEQQVNQYSCQDNPNRRTDSEHSGGKQRTNLINAQRHNIG